MANTVSSMTRASYDSVAAMNFSTLKHGLKSMRQLKWAIENPTERTDDMLVGLAWHLAVFEEGAFESRIFQFEGLTRRGIQWDACLAKATAANGYALTVNQYAKVRAMRKALDENEFVRSFLKSEGKGEQSIQWTDKDTGINLKGQVDRLCTMDYGGVKQPWILDGKTTSDLSLRMIQRTIVDYSLHMQAALYVDGLNAIAPCSRRYAWIFQETSPSFDSVIYEPSDNMIDEGRKVYKELLQKYWACRQSKSWPGRQLTTEAVEVIELPAWAFS